MQNAQLEKFTAAGQSIWLDNIRRDMFASGELRRLVDLGLRGMTSNPTIFEKSIGGSSAYDSQMRRLAKTVTDPTEMFEALAIDDIRHACDIFRPLYDASGGNDGFVSLEVSPLLAHDTKQTAAAAKRLNAAVDRPNLMVKIPATNEGIGAIRESIAAGININVTLIFALEVYEAAANAYIEGLEDRIKRGEPIAHIRSVNSVFVSRIDTAVDKMIEAKGDAGKHLLGKIANANTTIIYEKFQQMFGSDRFAAIRAKGGVLQRPLWGSTGTKNPKYSDLLYIEPLVGRDTVNTVPPATLDAAMDHANVKADAIIADIPAAHSVLKDLAGLGISISDLTMKLQTEGVESFNDSFRSMLQTIDDKRKKLLAEPPGLAADSVKMQLGADAAQVEKTLENLSRDGFLKKLYAKDPSPWSSEAAHESIIRHALGWLDFPEQVLASADEIVKFANSIKSSFDHIVVLGMGGSSLAPDVLRATYGRTSGFPQLHVLDSSDPDQVQALDNSLNISRSLFLVASKSGSTTEPDAFFRYFFDRTKQTVGEANASSHFIAVTDPGTKLDNEATALNFRRIFRNDPDIGGRYSALSLFGMIPAAIAGYDIRTILERGVAALNACGPDADPKTAPATQFGAAIGSLAKAGRDKLTILTHPKIAAYGTWAEQLVAESTGKSGTGIIPIEGEPLGSAASYGDDRVFVYVGDGLPDADAKTETLLSELGKRGTPVIRLRMRDVHDIGAQFALWEIAVATAGSVIGIDAFDQPNVQESKDNTKRLLDVFAKRGDGHFDEPKATVTSGDVSVMPLSGSKSIALGNDVASAISAIFHQLKPGDYVAFTAYLEMNAEHEALLNELRAQVRDAFKVATTVGFGPRFLHSTGQLHKGGANNGVFLQLTTEPTTKLMIPGMVEFGTLERAQALGDFESLDSRDRRGARFNLGKLASGLATFKAAINDAVSAKR